MISFNGKGKTYEKATTTEDGLMSKEDKIFLNLINTENYNYAKRKIGDQGTCVFRIIGNIVLFSISNYHVTSDISTNNETLFDGLPRALGENMFIMKSDKDNHVCRFYIDYAGNMKIWWSSLKEGGNVQYYGTGWYIKS